MNYYSNLNAQDRQKYGTYLGVDNQAWQTAYDLLMKSLKEGTEYRVMAFATNDAGTSYGEIVYFVTEKNEIEIELPTVTTVTVSEITYNTAVVSAEVLTDGGADVTERGFMWNKTDAGDNNTERVKVGEGLAMDFVEMVAQFVQ